MSTGVRAGSALLILGLSVVACASDAECDAGQKLEGGQCVPMMAAAGSAGSGAAGSAGSTGGGGGAAGASPDAGQAGAAGGGAAEQCDAEWGATCADAVDHSDCGCPASYCAVQPGKTSGYCTATGCKEDPSVCPSDWGCLDLGLFQPGLPSICTRP